MRALKSTLCNLICCKCETCYFVSMRATWIVRHSFVIIKCVVEIILGYFFNFKLDYLSNNASPINLAYFNVPTTFIGSG